jgi:hypothetical protein
MWVVVGMWEPVFVIRCEEETREGRGQKEEEFSRERGGKNLLERRGGTD